jgi:hypothetical protein
LPTIDQKIAQAQVETFLRDNAGCKFPCWWGITPRQTKADVAFAFLTPLSYQHDISGDGAFQFYVPNINDTISQHYFVRNGLVEMIAVHFGNITTLTLANILTDYGPPSQIKIRTFSTVYEGNLPYYLILFYQDQSLLVLIESLDAELQGPYIHKCFSEDHVWDLLLWSPTAKLSFEQASEKSDSFNFNDGFPLLSLEEATQMDSLSFTSEMTDPARPNCLDTPVELWPGQFQ